MDEIEDELKLLPTDPETDSARQMIMESQLPVGSLPTQVSEPKLQFGLRHLLLATTVVAVSAAMIQWYSPSFLAGAMGLLTLVFLFAISIIGIRHPTIRFAWLCFLILYLAYAILASIGIR